MDEQYGSFEQLNKFGKEREIVIFGCGNIAKKTLQKLIHRPKFIVDNNPNSWGSKEFSLNIFSTEKLKEIDRPYMIICTTSFDEVVKQLISLGYLPRTDFIISPIMNDLRIISDIENVEAILLFSSGAAASNCPDLGGGVYEMKVKDGSWAHRKVLDGTSHGIIERNGNFVITHDEVGIVELSRDYEIIRTGDVPTGARPHGIAFCKNNNKFYVAASCLDAVLIFDESLELEGQISLSNKFCQTGEPCHHLNDICIVEDSLYVSMFSVTGNWKRDVFDGAVLEFDLTTNERVGVVIDNLWMPHNVEYIAGSLSVLDSLRGEIKKSNAQPIGKFPGFTRGVGYDGRFFFIGQSRNRNYSKYLGLSQNISMDTSIIVFDEKTKVSKSLFLPHRLSEIHSIRVVN
jgi:hypothetical protein